MLLDQKPNTKLYTVSLPSMNYVYKLLHRYCDGFMIKKIHIQRDESYFLNMKTEIPRKSIEFKLALDYLTKSNLSYT